MVPSANPLPQTLHPGSIYLYGRYSMLPTKCVGGAPHACFTFSRNPWPGVPHCLLCPPSMKSPPRGPCCDNPLAVVSDGTLGPRPRSGVSMEASCSPHGSQRL